MTAITKQKRDQLFRLIAALDSHFAVPKTCSPRKAPHHAHARLLGGHSIAKMRELACR
jgi:hypothetical protein